MSEHAKEPWSVGVVFVDDTLVTAVLDRDGDEICNMGTTSLDEDANASRIVTCVNSFPLLYEALEAVDNWSRTANPMRLMQELDPIIEQCRIALRAARGEK